MAVVWRFDAIGTTWRVETTTVLDTDSRDAVSAIIDRFDAQWSRFRADSLVRRLAGGGTAPAPADAAVMLDAYAALTAATDGAVDPLVGASLEALGYDAQYSLRAGAPVARTADWRSQLTWQGDTLALSAPGVIDVGALGKGRLVDLVIAEIAGRVHGLIVVDAGGDIRIASTTERIGLEHPYDPRRAIGVWEVTDAALCASAVNRRAWGEGLHHVLDARTGAPVRTIAATWALAPSAMVADGVATALFFDGGAELAHRWGVHWVRMSTDGRVEWSPGCRAELFLGPDSVDSD